MAAQGRKAARFLSPQPSRRGKLGPALRAPLRPSTWTNMAGSHLLQGVPAHVQKKPFKKTGKTDIKHVFHMCSGCTKTSNNVFNVMFSVSIRLFRLESPRANGAEPWLPEIRSFEKDLRRESWDRKFRILQPILTGMIRGMMPMKKIDDNVNSL